LSYVLKIRLHLLACKKVWWQPAEEVFALEKIKRHQQSIMTGFYYRKVQYNWELVISMCHKKEPIIFAANIAKLCSAHENWHAAKFNGL